MKSPQDYLQEAQEVIQDKIEELTLRMNEQIVIKLYLEKLIRENDLSVAIEKYLQEKCYDVVTEIVCLAQKISCLRRDDKFNKEGV